MTTQRWYHINSVAGATRIVSATAEIDGPRALRIRVPTKSYGETPMPRVCIAPTVWQCCIGAPASGGLTIYEVVLEQRPTPADGTIVDRAVTDEAWITQLELDAAGGTIQVHAIGNVEVDRDCKLSLKIRAQKGELPTSHEGEMHSVWDVTGDTWLLREDIRLPPCQRG